MKSLVFLFAVLCGAALFGLSYGSWIARAAVSLLAVSGFSLAFTLMRAELQKRLQVTDTIARQIVYGVVGTLASAAAAVAAAYVPHSGHVTAGAVAAVAVTAVLTSLTR